MSRVGLARGFDERPAGERYYRHPGDVVALVVWVTTTLLFLAMVQLATGTTTGLAGDLGRAATAVPRPVRQLALSIVQIVAFGAPLAVAVALVARRRWRRYAVIAVASALAAAAVAGLDALI
ncbi:MAG: hypothetical protein M3487_13315, partial [Actinomycetota bacterium]|nr:hypothetical protein [Actinomycetota bacterium]